MRAEASAGSSPSKFTMNVSWALAGDAGTAKTRNPRWRIQSPAGPDAQTEAHPTQTAGGFVVETLSQGSLPYGFQPVQPVLAPAALLEVEPCGSLHPPGGRATLPSAQPVPGFPARPVPGAPCPGAGLQPSCGSAHASLPAGRLGAVPISPLCLHLFVWLSRVLRHCLPVVFALLSLPHAPLSLQRCLLSD